MAFNQRFTLNNDQLSQYFDRLALPKYKRILSVSALSPRDQLMYLETLIKHHQTRIPFENLTQHYSWHRTVDVKPLHIFRKVTTSPGRGGYCMELNSLFNTFLLSLGFTCYIAAGRVWEGSRWTGWSHLVNILTIGGTKHLVDVGFGGNEPTVPIRLEHGEVVTQIPPTQSRLLYETLPQNLSDCKVWIHQLKIDANAEWMPMYCFTEMEILPTDIPGLNLSPWLSHKSIFTQKVMCVRFTTSQEGNEPGMAKKDVIEGFDIDGALIVDHDKFKWRRNGKTELEVHFKSEDERVDALRKYFGIELDVEEREAVLGTTAAIRS